MHLIAFALRKPITLMMVIVALLGGGVLAMRQMRVDIFPALNEPQIYVINNYSGMGSGQIEGFVTNVYEQNFQFVDGLKTIESKNIQNLVLIKLAFFPGTDMSAAMSQVVSLANRARGQMPPSVLPPFVMRFDAANVPIGYLVLEGENRPLGELTDLAMYRVRPLLGAQIPGTVSFAPFGSNTRAIVISVSPMKLHSHNLSPDDVVDALVSGNIVSPSGNIHEKMEVPMVSTNTMVVDPQELAAIPIDPGKNVYIRDVATVQDATDINYGCALVNGRKSVYLPVVKKDTASTLTVVNRINESLPVFQSMLPDDVRIRYEFDESPTVRAAIKTVATEGLIGAALTGLMILVFLRDVRSVFIVVLGIPLALTASLVALWATGNTMNIMSLGGLALAIGILVDMAIVTVEYTHAQLHHTPSLARAVWRSDAVTASARLLAMLCVLAVFIPSFLMEEPIRSLFMPLTLAVGFEPGDIVSGVMSLGSPMPVEVVVAGPNRNDARAHSLRILAEMKKIPTLRDVQIYQQLNYPTIDVTIDRVRAGMSGVTVKDVADALLVATSSSRYVAKNYWRDPRTGVDYQIQVQVPEDKMTRPEHVEKVTINQIAANSNLMLRDLAEVRRGTSSGEIDRSSMQRYLSVVANVEGEDLGRATRRIEKAIADAGEAPRGVRVQIRGQVVPMEEMFNSLSAGLALSVVVTLVLLTGYFQSFRLGLVSIGAVPGVICGVAAVLWSTGTP
jgi:multidrug efflux pump subunit AcrB